MCFPMNEHRLFGSRREDGKTAFAVGGYEGPGSFDPIAGCQDWQYLALDLCEVDNDAREILLSRHYALRGNADYFSLHSFPVRGE